MVISSCSMLWLGIMSLIGLFVVFIVYQKNLITTKSFLDNLKNNIKIPNFQISAGLTACCLLITIFSFCLLKTNTTIRFGKVNVVAKKCNDNKIKEKIALFNCVSKNKTI